MDNVSHRLSYREKTSKDAVIINNLNERERTFRDPLVNE